MDFGWRRSAPGRAVAMAGLLGLLAALAALALAATAAGRSLPWAAAGPVAGEVAAAAPDPGLPPPGGILVQVSGAVAHPGIYRLVKGDRASAAVAAAGGLTAEADPERAPNLAARLRDGELIRVPSTRSARGGRAAGRPPTDLNLATADELEAVPGVSPEVALAIVRHRQMYGPLRGVGDLVSILGMSRSDYRLARSGLRT